MRKTRNSKRKRKYTIDNNIIGDPMSYVDTIMNVIVISYVSWIDVKNQYDH